MKNLLAGMIVALTMCTDTATGSVFVNLAPSSAAVSPGASVSVDVTISGLPAGGPPSVGAFDISVGFDSTLLNPVGVSFGPFLGDPLFFEAITAFSLATTGVLEFAEVSLLASSDLDALQPSSFKLATLNFTGIGTGSSAFTFVGDIRVDDAFGGKLQVPEPPTVLLLGLALSVLFNRGLMERRS